MQNTSLASVSGQPAVRYTLDSIHKVGLAGLGACSRVQKESSKLFQELVTKGETLQADLRQNLNSRLDNAEQRFEDVVKDAKGTWNKLGESMQGYLGKAVKQMGVASKDDVDKLSMLVEKLDRSVLELAEARKLGQPTA
jgi:poly(hydroxyalkanoate) granule-associated protein